MHGVKRRQWTKDQLKQKKEKDRMKIDVYSSLVNSTLDRRDKNDHSLTALEDTTKLLDMNPEFNTMWNYRRDIIAKLKTELPLQFWDKELKFIMVQLKKFPKVYWIWNHRIWVLNNYPGSPASVWERELDIVSALLEVDARNFHGWHYRRMVVGKLENITGKSMDAGELAYASKKINNNISNFSAWHQRVQLIDRMFANGEIEDRKEFMEKEINYLTNAMFTDAEDQSVWFYINWFVNYPLVQSILGKEQYIRFLESMTTNILMINDDDIEFSGSDNSWCLKILLVIEQRQKELSPGFESHSVQYLEKLVVMDPLRKNRYLHLLSKQ
ncbi:Rab geranylgeranyltransferase BET4 KNAG_0I01780 [Huiozyma naganishii CBS 8797]|uniref:Geranylgeranyl transferase type-2 subunit alpha n=1 Tax=Huiozyma naganishii (strain ATCC MYA-139 / BCRC 22969 / CBS 8797 / KCTC 17520 / NBRC 10181 / NCYC 3082 / Yp74L-3) TaxID=1071383 RepID=J7RQC2_HUIN7|nr:hypothetical protein KNAG_0I01780 [Kazachstania naganishii CBS 8797]CCK71963.1 hypothetical protein KNAG_0I01780 [Kazachstania naganishii CBS 8797]